MNRQLQSLNIALPIGSLDAYIEMTRRIPLLSQEEEHELAIRWHENEDLAAARQLILAHLRYVVSVAKKYSGYGLALSDLIQEGSIGLMKAVKRFDPHVGVRLVTFAMHWIKAEIHEFVLRNWRIVKIATTKAQRKLFFKLKDAQKRLGWGNQTAIKNIADDLSVKTDTVIEMDARLNYQDTDLEAILDMADHHADPAKIIEKNSDGQQHQHSLLDALEKLDHRSRDILTKRWLNEKKSTLEELAAIYQVSIERIRQIEKAALGKLRTVIDAAMTR